MKLSVFKIIYGLVYVRLLEQYLTCTVLLASFLGPAQLSVACSLDDIVRPYYIIYACSTNSDEI